jgi:2-polyprenyl-6-methoxyphenol hydroxylase-like FAD-dependent oxidoreductase
MRARPVLVVGAGISGPAVAYWLRQAGFEPTIVEQAPRLRTGGYVIDFWGSGFRLAERMNLRPELERRGYHVRELRVVGAGGKRVAGASAASFVRATDGRYVTIPRGDLAALVYESLRGEVETIFGDSIARLQQSASSVRVTFERGGKRDFDLVVGADGLHSRVRALTLGPQERWERYLGIRVAAFELEGYAPRDDDVYVMYTEVGRQAARFSMRGDRTTFLLTWLDPDPRAISDPAEQRAVLRERFAGAGWEVPRILERLDDISELYFDRASQIRIAPPAHWHSGRIVLLGDAAFCPSLLAGEGSGLAMTGAYVLAAELAKGADLTAAFERYEARFRPYAQARQRAGLGYAATFAPRSRWAIVVRNVAIDLMGLPWIGDRIIGAQLKDPFTLAP